MSKGQKRLAAIFLCIMGIVGTLMALKDRQYMEQETARNETVIETSAEQTENRQQGNRASNSLAMLDRNGEL